MKTRSQVGSKATRLDKPVTRKQRTVLGELNDCQTVATDKRVKVARMNKAEPKAKKARTEDEGTENATPRISVKVTAKRPSVLSVHQQGTGLGSSKSRVGEVNILPTVQEEIPCLDAAFLQGNNKPVILHAEPQFDQKEDEHRLPVEHPPAAGLANDSCTKDDFYQEEKTVSWESAIAADSLTSMESKKAMSKIAEKLQNKYGKNDTQATQKEMLEREAGKRKERLQNLLNKWYFFLEHAEIPVWVKREWPNIDYIKTENAMLVGFAALTTYQYFVGIESFPGKKQSQTL